MSPAHSLVAYAWTKRRVLSAMKATELLRNFGQSLWLDNITRDLLNDGTLKRYIDELSITGLTSNPTIFDHAIKNSSAYDEAILDGRRNGKNGEALFFDLALEDIRRAADLFRPVHERTDGVDGWVSLEVPPSLAYDTMATVVAAKDLSARADRPNVFIKIPGTPEGLLAIEEAIFAGVPINVTLLFSAEQYIAAAEAYMRGIERRIEAGLNPKVESVASLFVSRWDVAVANKVPEGLKSRLGITVAGRAYKSYLSFLSSRRWQRAYNFGAHAQRLLWASTGTKDPLLPDTFYVKSLAAPFTVNTMPDATLKAFGDHGIVNKAIEFDQSSEEVMQQFFKAGIDVYALGLELQNEGAKSFVKSWVELMNVISAKGNQLSRPK
jgi:transaldolase